MQGKSVACTLLQLFNKVSIIVQVPTAPVSGTSSSWAVERTIVVCVLEKLIMPRAEAYGSSFVCHYAEGGATEAYCSRAVCLSFCLSVCYKHFSSLTEN